MSEPKGIALFEEKHVRRIWDEKTEKWYFSIVDVCAVLTDQPTQKNASTYWAVLKSRLKEEEGADQLLTNCKQLKMKSADGKNYKTDATDAEGLLRIIQSIPSPKAEPFKRWLAKVGYERIQEIEDPELAAKRMHDLYLAKGYSEEWVGLRIRGIATRDTLTDEWNNRGVTESKDYSILTAEISKAAFGMTPSQYKEFKSLDKKASDNLRDHMTDLELIFTQLSEAATTEIARNVDAQGFEENKDAAKRGGKVAGDARKDLEKQTGRPVSTRDNYKHLTESKKRKGIKE